MHAPGTDLILSWSGLIIKKQHQDLGDITQF